MSLNRLRSLTVLSQAVRCGKSRFVFQEASLEEYGGAGNHFFQLFKPNIVFATPKRLAAFGTNLTFATDTVILTCAGSTFGARHDFIVVPFARAYPTCITRIHTHFHISLCILKLKRRECIGYGRARSFCSGHGVLD